MDNALEKKGAVADTIASLHNSNVTLLAQFIIQDSTYSGMVATYSRPKQSNCISYEKLFRGGAMDFRRSKGK